MGGTWDEMQERTVVTADMGTKINNPPCVKARRFVCGTFFVMLARQTSDSGGSAARRKNVECTRPGGLVKQLVGCCIMCTTKLLLLRTQY